jgi:hypothetical protein
MRRSGLQTDVLTLYRKLLKEAAKKNSKNLKDCIKSEFRRKAFSISRNDYQLIEHELRYGNKQLKLIAMPGFVAASYSN